MNVFRAEVYKAAAKEHVAVAGELYDIGRYVLCCYVSGLSVECMLRAYRLLKNPQFDAKHDLKLLSEDCGWSAYIPEQSSAKIAGALKGVYTRWDNAHRFRSTIEYRRYLRRRGLHQGIRGDFVKEQTRQALQAAEILVRIGASSWPRESSRKN